MGPFKKIIAMISYFLPGFSRPNLENHRGLEPEFNFYAFFNGNLEAQGLCFILSNEPSSSFHLDIKAERNGDTITMKEVFFFNNGETTSRTWNFQLINNHEFIGTANDVIGTAKVKQVGNAVNTKYTLRSPYGKFTFDLSMDSWMYLMNKDNVLSRTSIYKFGIKVGELFSVIRKVN